LKPFSSFESSCRRRFIKAILEHAIVVTNASGDQR